MKYLSLIVFISLCCTTMAQQTVKYLPSKIESGETYHFEYDNLNRISKIKIVYPQSEDVWRVSSHLYTYSNTGNFTDKRDEYLQKNDSVINLDSELSKYEKHGSNFICTKINLFPKANKDPLDNTYEVNYEINSNNLISKISYTLPSKIYVSTRYYYNSQEKMDSIKLIYKEENKTENSDMYFKYKTNNTNVNKGIFRDINFVPISVQTSNLPFIIANQVPNEISTKINKNSISLGEIIKEDLVEAQYTFDENGYPKSIILINEDKKHYLLISDIEYIKVEN